MSKFSFEYYRTNDFQLYCNHFKFARERERVDCRESKAFNPRTISLIQFSTAFLRWHCGFSKSRLYAIDRAAVARRSRLIPPIWVTSTYVPCVSPIDPFVRSRPSGMLLSKGKGRKWLTILFHGFGAFSVRIIRSLPPVLQWINFGTSDTMLYRWPTDPNAKAVEYRTVFSARRNNVRVWHGSLKKMSSETVSGIVFISLKLFPSMC